MQEMEKGSHKKVHLDTPRRTRNIRPKRIFRENGNNKDNRKKPEKVDTRYRDRNLENKINLDIGKMNLEILLMNTLMIIVWKVQTVIDQFMRNKPYTSIFCFTETKVDRKFHPSRHKNYHQT